MALELKARLKRANGWQRLWIILSVLAVIGSIFLCIIEIQKSRERSDLESLSVQLDMLNPNCAAYLSDPFSTLKATTRRFECNFLYQYRWKSINRDARVTDEIVNERFRSSYWSDLAMLVFVVIGAALLSALVYFVGFLFAWVVAGFRKKVN